MEESLLGEGSVNVIEDSIPQLFKSLCIHCLKKSSDPKTTLIFKQDYKPGHVEILKKTLYRKLFVTLHSPIILPTPRDYDDKQNIGNSNPANSLNIYSDLARDCFELDMSGHHEKAERLRSLITTLAEKKNENINNMLKLFKLLASYDTSKSKTKRLFFNREDYLPSDTLFQLDQKALSMDNSGVDLFGSGLDVNDDVKFNIQNTEDMFSMKPSTGFFGHINRNESTYSKDVRSNLFGGLTSSFTTSLDVSLDIPDLKEQPSIDISLPTDTKDFYELSSDEGFFETMTTNNSTLSSTPRTENYIQSLDLLDEALKENPDQKSTLAWESKGSYNERLDNNFLVELGDEAFDRMYKIKMGELEKLTGKRVVETKVSVDKVFRDTLNVLIGVQSSSYTFLPVSFSLVASKNIHCTGLSSDALHSLMAKFASLGTHYRQLRKFCSQHADRPKTGHSGGSLLKAFIDAMKEILQSYWFAVFSASEMKMVLTELWHLFEPFSKQFKLLADICLCSEAFRRTGGSGGGGGGGRGSNKPKFPVGPALLSYLYSLAVKNSSTEHFRMLLYLFRCTSIPYINFISEWLFHGVCRDQYDEFFVQLDQQYLSYRDKYFWSQGFRMKESKASVPLFLDGLANQIFSCGKAINLLKLTNIQHHLFDSTIKPPRLAITFSSKRLEDLSRENRSYLAKIANAERKYEEDKQRKLLEEEEDWKERLRAAKETTETALNEIKEMEDEIKIAIQEKKNKELKELQIQFQQAVEDRKMQRQQKLEEDHAFLNEVARLEDKDSHARAQAREEIISYYKALTEKAEQRERHAQWIIERYNLSQKRKDFFLQNQQLLEREVAEEEERRKRNPWGVTDIEDDQPLDNIDHVDNINQSERSTNKRKKWNTTGTQQPLVGLDHVDNVNQSESPINESDDESSAKGSIWSSLKTESTMEDSQEDSAEMSQAIWDNINTSSLEINNSSQAIWDDINMSRNESKNKRQTLYKGDQTVSEAKGILYPVESPEGNTAFPTKSSYQNQFYSDFTDFEKRDLMGHSSQEGKTTKDILYPTTENAVGEHKAAESVNFSRAGEEGSVTKSLMYPGDSSTDTDSTGKQQSRSGQEGGFTKSLIYPGDSTSSLGGTPNHQQSKAGQEGSYTKSLIYPEQSTTNDSYEKMQVDQRQIEDGAETKNLLYGVEENVETFQSTRGMHSIEGRDTKSLLYPVVSGDNMTDSVARTTGESSNVEGSETKGSAGAEGTETKSLLYPKDSPTGKTLQQHQIKQFENPSVVQNLLYPKATNNGEDASDDVIKKSRGFEPPTRIKEMMYPTTEEKVKEEREIKALRPEDVWMDLMVEPFQDDFTEIIEKDPHPYRFWENNNNNIPLQFQQDEDENADVIEQLPLETIVKRSLLSPIQSQIVLVNKAVVQYFLHDLHIEAHFDAFRKFLLLEDGEFGHALCSQLFQKIASGMKPQNFCNAIHLNNIIIEALRMSLYASRIEYSNQLTFALKNIPDIFRPSDVGVLDFLELRYQVPWPCNIIITENSINKYNRVFSSLIRLKRAGWSLQEIWVNLKKAGHSRRAASSPQLRQLQLFRHEMQHFVNNLERYMVNQIIHVSWEEFQQDLREQVNDLDDLHRCHTTYLNRIIFRSLLSKNAAPVYKLINDIFGMISNFETRLISQSWEEDKETGHVTHPSFSRLKQNYKAFRQCVEFLFSVISKLVRRGYQDHLADLLLQVNFNSYYTNAVVQT
ncbi:gamma-tubulin complex component 6-like isoform X2 [Clytia hemisphaerica]|uniref:gamma-tubulin complex component 6-like isoform X2 n=1 Tax=Clytia hemisphaerica TaxID=252671 RepID=UPI0034D40E57